MWWSQLMSDYEINSRKISFRIVVSQYSSHIIDVMIRYSYPEDEWDIVACFFEFQEIGEAEIERTTKEIWKVIWKVRYKHLLLATMICDCCGGGYVSVHC